ncbi:TIGR02281 family clan AA aspartic protease [Brevundimonas sp.]|jgi:aspartyl protease family protein|uniref:TIGR02281 family clan AA aspartic protease n=1 Tax=Brevundimonas sp. TaxID=1871086 RepID=UPI002E0FEDA0|nr:TIGR02281 family clan AA aspartic protease [Brevundimonas sp.]
MRLGLSNLAAAAMAVGSAFTAAWWLNQLDGPAPAHAAVPVVVQQEWPERSQASAAQVLRAPDGHWWADAVVDGRAVRLMVDTGATVVALTPQDARRLGLELAPGDFSDQITTAAGPARAARVRLASLSVGAVRVSDVDAVVVERGLPHSLLGMSWLGRLSGFEASADALTLRP